MNSGHPSKTRSRLVQGLLSYAVAGGCLYWVFHNLDFHALLRSLARVRWWLMGPAVLLDLGVYVLAAWEWKILLRPVSPVSLGRTLQAMFAGRFANDVLPVHVGYVVRVYLVSRWTGAKIAAVAPSLLVERLFDGFWLALGIGLTTLFFHVPEAIARVAEMWTGIIVFGLIAAAVMVLKEPRRTGPARQKFRSRWVRKLCQAGAHVLEQVRAIGRSWLVLGAFVISFLKFAAQALAFLFLLWAWGFRLPFGVQLAVFLVAYVGLSMPSTPASVGVFQLFCIAGLQMVHVPKPAATGFALLAFVVLTAPLALAGFFALAQTGLTLRQVRAQARTWTWKDG